MPGMRSDGQFQNKRPPEEYDAAVDRALSIGHGGIPIVASETGIPKDTLDKKIQVRKREMKANLVKPVEIPEFPGKDATPEMAERALTAIWHELCRITDPDVIAAAGKLDVKRLGDLGTATKMWQGIDISRPRSTQSASALAALSKGNGDSGSSSREKP